MKINGLTCRINLPEAPSGDGVYDLPPYHEIKTYKVDDYNNCPSNWMRSNNKASSYFFPVQSGKHLWLDFNNNTNNRYHIAIVMSIQGINPITGLKTKSLEMQQYKDKCPIHDIEFMDSRFCKQCNYKWPAQNYITTTNYEPGKFWVDGWRADDETIRGFLITEDTMKGIAAQLIGDDRVWAIGIAFYLSKAIKPIRPIYTSKLRYETIKTIANEYPMMNRYSMYAGGGENLVKLCSREVEVKNVEIGGGAKIAQSLGTEDPESLDFYNNEPTGVIYGNYCLYDDFNSIIAGGVKDLTANGEGFLRHLQTGN